MVVMLNSDTPSSARDTSMNRASGDINEARATTYVVSYVIIILDLPGKSVEQAFLTDHQRV